MRGDELALPGGPGRDALERGLARAGFPGARVVRLSPLGGEVQEGLKALGYGRPVRVDFERGGVAGAVVLRTVSSRGFGHDRRADRVAALVLDRDTFGRIPRHAAALEVGVIDGAGELVPIPDGEPYLLTDHLEGDLYAADLARLEARDAAAPLDLDRARALARYLAALHAAPASATAYRRAIRDTLGSGEGIFGIAESYPPGDPVVPRARLVALEQACVAWRWRLFDRADRARRTHGDFHPFNILFREGLEFSVLDCSRGAAGDPADDVACLAINPLFFALVARGAFTGALRDVWDAFWGTYLEATGDRALLEVAAPFFAWRALVLASPAWYPGVAAPVRDRLLGLAERLLAGAPLDPARIDEVLP